MKRAAIALVICAVAQSSGVIAQTSQRPSVIRRLEGDLYPPLNIYYNVARCSWKKNYSAALDFMNSYKPRMFFDEIKDKWVQAVSGCNAAGNDVDIQEMMAFSEYLNSYYPDALIYCAKSKNPTEIDGIFDEFHKASAESVRSFVENSTHVSDTTELLACDENFENQAYQYRERRAAFLRKLLGKRIKVSTKRYAGKAAELS